MIELQTIKFIHEYLTEYFKDLEDPIQPPGIKNEGGVESAANRPNLNPEYDTPYLKAASVFHGIINNHPFIMAINEQLYFLQFIILENLAYCLKTAPMKSYMNLPDKLQHMKFVKVGKMK